MRILLTLISILIATPALAGESPYFDHSKKLKLVAWSPDGKSFAYRRERVQWHKTAMEGGMPENDAPSKRTQIDVFVQRCASMKTQRCFPITGLESESKKARGKNWKKAEAWLEKQGYVFVTGKKAKPVENDLMEVPEETYGLGFPLPRRLKPEWMKTLYLRVGTADFDYESELKIFDTESHLLVGLAGEVEGDPDLWQKYDLYLHHDGALPSLDNGTSCTVEYGPDALCFVLTCTGMGAYTSVQTTQQSFRVGDLKKHLPPKDWSSHSEQ